MSLEVGGWYWLSDEAEYVLPGKLEKLAGKGAIFLLEDGTEKTISTGDMANLQALDKQCLDPDVSNLIGLSNLSENAIMHNLRIRFKNDKIYTFVSSILIAVNPFRQLPIYGVEVLELYKSTPDKTTLPPHIFTIADNAFRAMINDGTSQSVVVSGESGAGKTESTKLLLEYIAELSGKQQKGDESIQEQILQANPVMEAFGNAKTVRNNNSSRFGKLITIHFHHSTIKGASIISYLLEKSRVVHQQQYERNYHFFYQILAETATNAELAKELYLDNAEAEYFYINQSGVSTIEGVSDAEEFNEVQNAMQTLGISEQDQIALFKLVSGILHIGNISFSSADTAGDAAARIVDSNQLRVVSLLLGFSTGELERCLTTRNIGTRSIITCTYTPVQAVDARDALAKKLYSMLFDWLIAAINISLQSAQNQSKVVIAVLDIFGFESFEHNSFEQLCINFCNEKLQFHFNNHIFKMEQAEYAREGIDVEAIVFEDNQITLDLLEVKSTGIFSMVDEEIVVPRGSDESLLNKLMQKHAKHPSFDRAKPKIHKNAQECFVVIHYAGAVAYNISGFLEKNKDSLSEDLVDVGRHSSVAFIEKLFEFSCGPVEAKSSSRRGAAKSSSSKATLGSQFKQQLATLMDTLNATHPHFVRCMKPNMEKVGKKFDSNVMLAQLRYAGLLEVCRIRQLGYPSRMPFDKFFRSYQVLAPGSSDASNLAMKLTANGIIKSTEFKVGTSKIFMKHSAGDFLNSQRDKAFFGVALRIQRIARGRLQRKKFRQYFVIMSSIKNALNSRDMNLLQDIVAQSVELPYGGKNLDTLKKLKSNLRRLQEENRVNSLLQEAIDERQVPLLEGALRTARSMDPPLSNSLVSTAASLLEKVKIEQAHLATAATLLQSRDIAQLDEWLRKAETLDIAGCDAARAVQALVDRLADEMVLLEDIENAANNSNLEVLSAFLLKAHEMGLGSSDVVMKAKSVQGDLERIASASRTLEVALENINLLSITQAIEKASKSGVSASSMIMTKALRVRDILQSFEQMDKELKTIMESFSKSNITPLLEAVNKAESLLASIADDSSELFGGQEIEISSFLSAKALLQSSRQSMRNDEQQQDALAESIRSAIAENEFAYLRSLIPQAKAAGMSAGKYSSVMKEADKILDHMKGKMECEMALGTAVRMRDLTALESAILKAKAYNDISHAALNSASQMRDDLKNQEALISQITAATTAKDTDALQILLAKAENLNITGRVMQDARKILSREVQVEDTIKHLRDATDISSLTSALERAIQLGISGEVVDAARSRQAALTGASTIDLLLKAAIKNLAVVSSSENGITSQDIIPLENAITQNSTENASTGTLAAAKDALTLAKRQLDLQEQLLAINNDTSVLEISKLLRIAGDIGLKNFSGYSSAAALLAKYGDEILQKKQDSVVNDKNENKFETKKEELYKEARQPNYLFSNFPNLRSPEEFAKGHLLNKRGVMEGMLRHQKNPISHSLTKLDKEGERLALVVHKSLLGYCGDKAVTFAASLALDILNIGISNPNLRDEIFLQAIKHCMDNPSLHNQCRAMHIICLSCDTFSPSESFYYYLVNFLLSCCVQDATITGTKSDANEISPIREMALYALSRSQTMLNMGVVEHVDVESVEAYSVRLPTIAHIYAPDEHLLGELLVAPDVDVETLVVLLCQILNIHVKHRPLFGLYAVTTKSNALAPMYLLPDKDFYIGGILQAPLYQKYGRPLRYYMKQKALGAKAISKFIDSALDDNEESEDQIEALTNFTFAQLSKRVADDQVRITDHEKIAQLAAYALATEADFIPDRVDVAIGQGCLNFIPSLLKDSYQPEYWGNLVARALRNCVGRNDLVLKNSYIELLSSEFTSNMNTYITIKGSGSTAGGVGHIPNDMMVGIDENGIHFISEDTGLVAHRIEFSDIRKISLKQNSIKFNLEKRGAVGSKNSSFYDLELISPLNDEMSQIIMLYKPVIQEIAKNRQLMESRPTAAAEARMERLAALNAK